ncbi:MAG: SURF1 family protein [Candidatus Thiodiazotropha sp.]
MTPLQDTIVPVPATTRSFRPQAVPTVFMVILVPLFCALGVWQLDRAEQKRQLASNQEARRKMPTVAIGENREDPASWEFRSLRAEGRFLPQWTLLIENRKHQGRTGYHVITPLQLAHSEQILLVNRGWISAQEYSEQAPLPTPDESVTVHGQYHLPQAPALALEFVDSRTRKPPHWPYLTLEHFAQWSGLEPLPFALLQAPGDSSGFIRAWPRPSFDDGMHIGYAIQWFAFAAIALLLWLRLSVRPNTHPVPAS